MELISSRFFAQKLFIKTLCLVAGIAVCAMASARDIPDTKAPHSPVERVQTKFTTPDGFTHWRDEVNTGCRFADHSFTLDIDADPMNMSEIKFTMTNFDVDFTDPNNDCPSGPEVDLYSFNGNALGVLTGANNSWSVNTAALTEAQINMGSNAINIDTDSTNTGCWCVGVGYVEVLAKVGFKVKETAPKKDDKNRAFKAADVDLTVEFSDDYDPATLTNSTFLLEFRNTGGSYQPVSGSFAAVTPRKFEFVPAADLKHSVRYRATVKSGATGVKSMAGAELDMDEEWFFWTVPDLTENDAFAGACVPEMSPCDGIEIAVFQVARNKDIVAGKKAVARTYLRWKEHMDVFADDQIKELKAKVEMTGGGKTGIVTNTIKRPDKLTVADRKAAKNSINIYHTPTNGDDYEVEVTPTPQTNATPVKYVGMKAMSATATAPTMKYDYYFLKEGVWSAGVPGGVKTAGRALLTSGNQTTTDQFPVISTTYSDKGDFTAGYTATGNMIAVTNCGMVTEVNCPKAGGGTTAKAELFCVYEKLTTMLGGNTFVAATVPNSLCVGATAFALGGKVFMAQNGSGANDGTVAHEIGHIFGISPANSPTSKHRNNSMGVEGFQVRTKTNRSFTDDTSNTISLMHTTVQASGSQWIHNDDYVALQGASITRNSPSRTEQLAGGPFLIVSGEVLNDTNAIDFNPAFLQELPNDLPSASGQCIVQLLDDTGAIMAQDFVDPGLELIIDLADGSNTLGGPALPAYFSVSLPWSANADSVVMDCGAGLTAVITRSLSPPTVDLQSPVAGAILSGTTNPTWSGSDADGDVVSFQLQISSDGGTTWSPQTVLGDLTTLEIDTTLLVNGNMTVFRVMATDGFNTSYASAAVEIANALVVQSVLPLMDQTEVALGTDVSVRFTSDVDSASVTAQNFRLLNNQVPIAAEISYAADTRIAVLQPMDLLAADTLYTVELSNQIQGQNGEAFAAFSSSFTTESDSLPPSIIASVPANGDTNVPLNALVQVSFDEEVDATTLENGVFQLADANGNEVLATVQYFAGERRAILIPLSDLLEDTDYVITVLDTVQDLQSNFLDGAFEATFSTGALVSNGVRIVGNYEDEGVDDDNDGLFEALDILVDVEVLAAGSYNLNGRLLDGDERLIEWITTGNQFLQTGTHRLRLRYGAAAISNSGLNGPYTLDSLNFYVANNPTIADVGFNVFDTFPYNLDGFLAVLRLGPIPDQLFEVGSSADQVFNLRDLSFHISEPLGSLTYEVRVNSDPQLQVLIDSDANVSFIPGASQEINSDVTIEARDQLGNRVDARFNVRFEFAAVARLEADFATEMLTDAAQTIGFTVFDQFDRVLQSAVTVDLTASAGSVTPASVTTSTGEFSVQYMAGATPGTVFLTASSDTVSEVLTIVVMQGSSNCMVIGDNSLKAKDKKIEWRLNNSSDIDVTLSEITIAWPQQNGNLKKIKLNGTVYQESVPAPSISISDGWSGNADNRVIKTGKSVKLRIEFEEKHEEALVTDYAITATFAEGCSTTLTLTPSMVSAADELKIGGKEVKWKLTNDGPNPVTIKRIEIAWPAANGALDVVKLHGKIYDSMIAPPTALIEEQWQGDIEKRRLDPGKSKDLKFKFHENADTSNPDEYQIEIEFEEGGVVQH